MSTKSKFDVQDPEVVVLKNNRYAYRAECPTKNKDGSARYAYKFASKDVYTQYMQRKGGAPPESE